MNKLQKIVIMLTFTENEPQIFRIEESVSIYLKCYDQRVIFNMN